jgi:hypothetical protein
VKFGQSGPSNVHRFASRLKIETDNRYTSDKESKQSPLFPLTLLGGFPLPSQDYGSLIPILSGFRDLFRDQLLFLIRQHSADNNANNIGPSPWPRQANLSGHAPTPQENSLTDH